MRKELRLKLFKAIRQELGMDDPFSSAGLSHEEFINDVNRLKTLLLEMPREEPAESPSVVS